MWSPGLVASWLVLGTLPTERIPYFAAHWLVQGYDGPSVVTLAGLSGDDPHEVRDVLDAALGDCGVARPPTGTAVMETFTAIARMQADGRAEEGWVLDMVVEVINNIGYSSDVTDLPLGSLCDLTAEWNAGWGRTREELAARVRAACADQLALADSSSASFGTG